MKQQRFETLFRTVSGAAMAMPLVLVGPGAIAQTAPPSDELQEIVVTGDRLSVMQTQPVDSVFGFGKTVLETPRAITTISSDLMTKTIITDINDLVALAPGTFTQSFFGVAGSLDVRGSPGENYFRGMKRIDNPGNYPTPIGASDSIDIVRGPASPIFGPSKVGGYLNFIPKSEKADSNNNNDASGSIEATGGSWGHQDLKAQVSGPTVVFDKPLGYSLYGEAEDSGSYYENTHTNQAILQASFDLKISDNTHSEFGAMYQSYKGNQVAGWNRLTQQLIDNGTYITGTSPSTYLPINPATCSPVPGGIPQPIANQFGLITQAAANSAGLGCAFIFEPPIQTPASILAAVSTNPNTQLQNQGLAHLSGSQVLVAPQDSLGDNVPTAYFDIITNLDSGWSLTNKSFAEYLDNINQNAYGFSQYASTFAFEDKYIAAKKFEINDWAKTNVEFGPSVRYSHFVTGDDFSDEFFDRRDLTQNSGPLDARTWATAGEDPYSDHIVGAYTDVGLAAMADTTLFEKLSILTGMRGDYLDMKSHELEDSLTAPGLYSKGKKGAFSYNASISYNLPYHIVPYVTYSNQSTLITGQGGQIDPVNLSNGNAVAGSFLKEVGIKTIQLDGHFYAAVDFFIQQRTDLQAQDTVSNNTTQAKGTEFELRYVVSPQLTITGAFTSMAVYDLNANAANGVNFSFVGAGDLQGVNPGLIYGGTVGAVYAVNPDGSLKAGLPKTLSSLNFYLSADPWVHGLSGTVAVTHSSETFSGYSETVMLPAYTLLNMGVRYEVGRWSINAQVKNATNATYFRSNFPDLFGSSVVLPELPRNYLVSGTYKF